MMKRTSVTQWTTWPPVLSRLCAYLKKKKRTKKPRTSFRRVRGNKCFKVFTNDCERKKNKQHLSARWEKKYLATIAVRGSCRPGAFDFDTD